MDKVLLKALKKDAAGAFKTAGIEFIEKAEMGSFSSMKTGGFADLMVFPKDDAELLAAMRMFEAYGLKGCHVIGGGTNVLFADDKICLPVISFKKFNARIETGGGEGCEKVLQGGSGVGLSRNLNYLVKNNFGGCGFFLGHSGDLGGAVRMNAGSRESVTGNLVNKIEIITYGGKKFTVGRGRLKFSYRNMEIAGLNENCFITGVYLSLRPSSREEIMGRIGVYKGRKSSQPLGDSSLGCIFKNPSGESAGRIIEEIGFKGYSRGDAAVSQKHANFIINKGCARPGDVTSLIKIIQEKAMRARGIALNTEIKII